MSRAEGGVKGKFAALVGTAVLATSWRVYDNSGSAAPRLVAAGRGDVVTRVSDREA